MSQPLDIVITGIGIVSPLGVGCEPHELALLEAESSAIALRAALDPVDATEVWAAVVDGPNLKQLGIRGGPQMGRVARLGVAAARLALRDADLGDSEGADGGVVVGTAYGAFQPSAQFAEEIERVGPRHADATLFPNTVANATAGFISIAEKLVGPNATVTCGAGSANEAFRVGAQLLEDGDAEFVVAGGADSPGPWVLASLAHDGRLAMAGTEYRPPGDRAAAGIAPAEGAAFAVLERADRARERGASVLASLRATGAPTRALESSAELRLDALQCAVEVAGIAPRELGAVYTALSGDRSADDADARQLAPWLEAAGWPPLGVPKARFGHSFGASGAFAIVSAILALRSGTCPGTPGLTDPTLEGASSRATPLRGRAVAVAGERDTSFPVSLVLAAP